MENEERGLIGFLNIAFSGPLKPICVCWYSQCLRFRMGRELAASSQINLNWISGSRKIIKKLQCSWVQNYSNSLTHPNFCDYFMDSWHFSSFEGFYILLILWSFVHFNLSELFSEFFPWSLRAVAAYWHISAVVLRGGRCLWMYSCGSYSFRFISVSLLAALVRTQSCGSRRCAPVWALARAGCFYRHQLRESSCHFF